MSDNSKPTQNDALSFEQWLDKAERLDMGATYGPWQATSTGDKGGTFIEAEHVDVLNYGEAGHGHLRSEYAWMTEEDAEWIAWSRSALPAAVAALRAVADLHQPRNKVTRSASGHLVDTPGPCADCGWDWPCPTTVGVTRSLVGDDT